MIFIGKFLISLVMAGFVVSLASVAWPRISTVERPALIRQIYEAVKDTPLGKQTSQVLGVSDESKAVPINISDLMVHIKEWATDTIQQKAEDAVTKQAVSQISQNFGKLNEMEKDILRQAICLPATESAIR